MDAYTTALTLLSRRELSASQLRARLARRRFDDEEIEAALARLVHDRTLDDRRVALAAARLEGGLRRRGRRRALQRVRQLGIEAGVGQAAVEEVFAEIDEDALLDAAVERKLKGANPRELDDKGKARIVRSLTAQGFEPAKIFAALDKRRAG